MLAPKVFRQPKRDKKKKKKRKKRSIYIYEENIFVIKGGRQTRGTRGKRFSAPFLFVLCYNCNRVTSVCFPGP